MGRETNQSTSHLLALENKVEFLWVACTERSSLFRPPNGRNPLTRASRAQARSEHAAALLLRHGRTGEALP